MKPLGWLLLILTLVFSACAQYQPFEPVPADAIPEGPGLFTGEKGEWEIYRR